MGQAIPMPPTIRINEKDLEVVNQFQYLGSTATDSLSLDTEISKRIGKAATTLAKLTKRVWDNKHLTITIKVKVYRTCVISTLLYGSESWAIYAHQERKLQTFHMRCLRRILCITWQDKVTNTGVLVKADIPSMYTLFRQRHVRWIGHVHRMDDERIPKDLLYSELTTGKRMKGRQHLRFMDVCKRDMKACGIDTDNWEKLTANRSTWKSTVFKGLFYGEGKMAEQAAVKKLQRKASQHTSVEQQNNAPVFTCLNCGRHSKSKIGLCSHNRRCTTHSSTGAIP